MTKIIDFSALTFTDEQVRDLNELMFDAIVESEAFAKFHTIVSGIVSGAEMGFVGEFGLVGKAGQGCDPVSDDFQIGVTKKLWDPKTWEIIRDECFTNLADTLAIYAKKFGTEEPDLTNTAYMALVEDRLKIAIQKMLWRISWFNDTSAANVSDSPAGLITDGIDVDYFNILDGFWKQIFAIGTADSNRRVTIAANSSATTALQFSNFTPALAYSTLQGLIYNADPALRQESGRVIYATRSVVDKLEQYLTGQGIESTYQNLINGFDFNAPALKILGSLVQPIDAWDEIIRTYFDNGTTLYRPHRMVHTTKENLMVGTPSTSVIEHIDAFYDKKSRINRVEARDKIDAKIRIDKLVQAAY